MARRSSPVFRRARVRSPLTAGRASLLLGTIALIGLALFGVFGNAVTSPNLPTGGEFPGATPTAESPPQADPPSLPAGTIAAESLLDTIPVKGKSPRTGYDRTESFGTAWLDVDGNGCDTRNDILARDLTQIVMGERCRVLSGTVDDPYTGQLIAFLRGETTSARVQIDHVVALSNAWQTGAQQLSEEERIAFANDPLNLLAVDGTSNSQKGDGDTATWLPEDTSYRCEYVARQISVKAAYRLWVTEAEHSAMTRVLSRCPNQTAPAG